MNKIKEDKLIDKLRNRFFIIALIMFSMDFITTIIANRFGAKEINPIISYLFTIRGINYFLIYVFFIFAIILFMLFLELFTKLCLVISIKLPEKYKLDKLKIYRITYIVSLIVLVSVDLIAVINNILVINQYIQLSSTKISCTFS